MILEWSKVSDFNKPDNNPGYLLWKVSCNWRRAIEKVLKKFNITHPQFIILTNILWLTKDGNKISQADIAKQTNMDIATTSQILSHLEKKKMIARKHIAGNIRTKYTSLTKLGNEVMKESIPAVEAADKIFFKPISNERPNFMMKLIMLISENTK